MGLLKQLTKTALHIAISPIDVVKDIVTLGGELTDEQECYSVKRAKKISKSINSIPESIDNGLL